LAYRTRALICPISSLIATQKKRCAKSAFLP